MFRRRLSSSAAMRAASAAAAWGSDVWRASSLRLSPAFGPEEAEVDVDRRGVVVVGERFVSGFGKSVVGEADTAVAGAELLRSAGKVKSLKAPKSEFSRTSFCRTVSEANDSGDQSSTDVFAVGKGHVLAHVEVEELGREVEGAEGVVLEQVACRRSLHVGVVEAGDILGHVWTPAVA